MASFTFQLNDTEKERLTEEAAVQSGERRSHVSMAALACEALGQYLDRQEKRRAKRG